MPMLSLRVIVLAAAAYCASAACADEVGRVVVPSASFNISPLRLELKSADEHDFLLVRNQSDRESGVQVRVFSWTQADGADVYRPSDDFFISPSIISIPGQTAQTFRIIRRAPRSGGPEASYRVVIDELPTASNAGGQQAATRLRITVPLFDGTAASAPAALAWEYNQRGIVVHNTGGRSVKIANVAIVGQPSRSVESPGPFYVLAGSSRIFATHQTLSCTGSGIPLQVTVDGRSMTTDAPGRCI